MEPTGPNTDRRVTISETNRTRSKLTEGNLQNIRLELIYSESVYNKSFRVNRSKPKVPLQFCHEQAAGDTNS